MNSSDIGGFNYTGGSRNHINIFHSVDQDGLLSTAVYRKLSVSNGVTSVIFAACE